MQFHWWQTPTLLPVRWEGSLRLCRWVCMDRRSRLPFGGWLSREQIAAGVVVQPEEAVIPANLGHDKGTCSWSRIHEVVIPDVHGVPVVYMLTEPSSDYYRNMTSSRR